MRNEIITGYYLRTDIDSLCKKRGRDWAEELKSEVFLLLCELPEEIFNKKHADGSLIKWIKTTIKNMSCKSSNFYKDIKGRPYGITFADIDNADDIPDLTNNDTDNNISCLYELEQGINDLDFFHKDIMERYLKNNNKITKTARSMDINREYVGKLVNESKIMIKDNIKRNNGN